MSLYPAAVSCFPFSHLVVFQQTITHSQQGWEDQTDYPQGHAVPLLRPAAVLVMVGGFFTVSSQHARSGYLRSRVMQRLHHCVLFCLPHPVISPRQSGGPVAHLDCSVDVPSDRAVHLPSQNRRKAAAWWMFSSPYDGNVAPTKRSRTD